MDSNQLDLLPEEVDRRDEGCDLFPSCLSCPLPRCVEETSRGRQRLRMSARVRRMVRLKASGKSTRDIARLFGVTIRTVQRAIKSQKLKVTGTVPSRHSEVGETFQILRCAQNDNREAYND